MKNQTKLELYTDDNKLKYSSNPTDILKSTKKVMRNSTTVATTEFVCKILNRKKTSNEYFILFEAEISLDEMIKSINSETNKPPYHDCLTAEFYKHLN